MGGFADLAALRQPAKYSLATLDRNRWNVLDLITFGADGAVPEYLFSEIDMTWAEELRARTLVQEHHPTITALLIKAIGLAQKSHPHSRCIILPFGRVKELEKIVAGFTVERLVNDKPFVFIGTIDSPHERTIEEISAELNDYSEKKIEDLPQLNIEHQFTDFPWFIRQIFLKLAVAVPSIRTKYLGATFGITSLGKLGMTAILGPNVCTTTFGVGSCEERVVVKNGAAIVRKTMMLTMAFDHRVMTPVSAANFLKSIRELMEGGMQQFLQSSSTV